MEKFLGRYSEQIYAITRMVFGFLFMFRGAQKLFGWFDGHVAEQLIFQLAGLIEFGGGLLILIGFFGSLVAFIASGEMAVAYCWKHLPHSPLPVLNDGELSVLFCFFYLYAAAKGSGIWSVDAFRRRAAGQGPLSAK